LPRSFATVPGGVAEDDLPVALQLGEELGRREPAATHVLDRDREAIALVE
jgi:hypothetical protein